MTRIFKHNDNYYVNFPIIKYTNVNKLVSTILFIYSFIQLILIFSDNEIPKNIYIITSLISFFLSSIAFSLSWFGVKYMNISCPSN